MDDSPVAATTLLTMGNDDPTDAALVARVLEGEAEAFGDLYDRYARLVRAVLQGSARGDAAVQDLTQDCFLRAYRNLGRLRQPDRFGAWIVGIARQVARERRRASRRDRLRFPGSESPEAWSDPDQDGSLEVAEEHESVARGLACLPERERLAIHAFYLQEKDAGQAATLLRLSRSGFYALLSRAIARLAANVGRAEKEA
ncbi:sigma-70 family RNA polymerase sigma factor [Isosphaeraceae bacterium EP7]